MHAWNPRSEETETGVSGTYGQSVKLKWDLDPAKDPVSQNKMEMAQ